MRNIDIKLPRVIRLALALVKRRRTFYVSSNTPHYKRSSLVSLFIRAVIERINIKKALGTNLALLFIATSLVQKTNVTSAINADEYNILQAPVILTTKAGVQYPVGIVRITQGYKFYHKGLDLDGVTGDPIYPITAGRVESISRSRFAYGNSVIIDHGNGFKSLYAHLSKIDVVAGQEVALSTKLGEMGATGHAFGDHLHLEVYDNGKNINPLTILPH